MGRHLVTHLTSQAPLARSRVHGATCESEEPTLEIGLPNSVPALTVDGEDVTETLAALAFRLNSLSGFPPPSPPPSPGFPPPGSPPPAAVCGAAVVNGWREGKPPRAPPSAVVVELIDDNLAVAPHVVGHLPPPPGPSVRTLNCDGSMLCFY